MFDFYFWYDFKKNLVYDDARPQKTVLLEVFILFCFVCFFWIYGVSLLFLSVEAPRWRHVQDTNVSGVSVPDAAWPLPPQQLRLSICKCASALSVLLAKAPLMMVSCVSCCGGQLEVFICASVLTSLLWTPEWDLCTSASIWYQVQTQNTCSLSSGGVLFDELFWVIATAGAERHAGMETFRAWRVFCICGRRNQIFSSRSLIKNKKKGKQRWKVVETFMTFFFG